MSNITLTLIFLLAIPIALIRNSIAKEERKEEKELTIKKIQFALLQNKPQSKELAKTLAENIEATDNVIC